MHPMNQFEVELSLKLAIPISQLKKVLTNREYDAYQKFYFSHGFGEMAAFERSANQIITIINYITGAAGGKPPGLTTEDIYPQLSFKPKKKKKRGNNTVDWDKTRPGLQQELIELGLYDKEGNPTNTKQGDT